MSTVKSSKRIRQISLDGLDFCGERNASTFNIQNRWSDQERDARRNYALVMQRQLYRQIFGCELQCQGDKSKPARTTVLYAVA